MGHGNSRDCRIVAALDKALRVPNMLDPHMLDPRTATGQVNQTVQQRVWVADRLRQSDHQGSYCNSECILHHQLDHYPGGQSLQVRR